MSVHRSHDRPRLEATKLRDISKPASVGTAPTPDEKRPFRAPRRRLSAALRRRAEQAVGVALSGHETSQTGSQLAQTALSLYRAGQRELNTSSPIALSHLLRWAVGTAVSQALVLEASDDLGSERSRALLDLSTRLEGRAERASVAAITCAGLLGGKRPSDADGLARLLSGKAQEGSK